MWPDKPATASLGPLAPAPCTGHQNLMWPAPAKEESQDCHQPGWPGVATTAVPAQRINAEMEEHDAESGRLLTNSPKAGHAIEAGGILYQAGWIAKTTKWEQALSTRAKEKSVGQASAARNIPYGKTTHRSTGHSTAYCHTLVQTSVGHRAACKSKWADKRQSISAGQGCLIILSVIITY